MPPNLQFKYMLFQFLLQKLLSHSFIREPEVRESFHWAKSIWSNFLVHGLGMIPLVEDAAHELSHKTGAFELLRVRMPFLRTSTQLIHT
jgi:hypothetical protein